MSPIESFSRIKRWPRIALVSLSLGGICAITPIQTAIAHSPLDGENQTHRNPPAQSEFTASRRDSIPPEQIHHPPTTLHDARAIASQLPPDRLPRISPVQTQFTTVSPEESQFDPHQNAIAQQLSACPNGLQVESVSGEVTFEGQLISAGECLQPATGTIVTDVNSTARLRLDNFRGSIEVAEVTEFNLETLSDSNVDLFVQQGRVRFSVGRLSQNRAALPAETLEALKTTDPENPAIAQNRGGDSPFRVRTPTGVAGVRGTSFGVDVGPNGQTGVRTLAGTVIASGQGQEVTVGRGQFTVIGPGSAPLAPQEIPPESKFRVLLTQVRGMDLVRIEGKIDPPDILLLDGELVETNSDGTFSLLVPRPRSRRFRFVVRGPAVRERVYVVPIR